jgi:protein O-GlcNAc transferase
MLARQGASLLTCAGLAEWIAYSKQEYIAKALSFSRDLGALSSLREKLRGNAYTSPLFDAIHFARNFESAMQKMWEIKEPPSN